MADLGTAQLAEALEVHVAHADRQRGAPVEGMVGLVQVPAAARHEPEVVVREGAAALVTGPLEGFEGARVVVGGAGVVPLNAGQDAEVLLDPAAERIGAAREDQGVLVDPAGPGDLPALEFEAGQGVERFAGEHEVSEIHRLTLTPAAEILGPFGFIAAVVHHAEPPQRLHHHGALPRGLAQPNRLLIGGDRVVEAPGAILGAAPPQHVAGGSQQRVRKPGRGKGPLGCHGALEEVVWRLGGQLGHALRDILDLEARLEPAEEALGLPEQGQRFPVQPRSLVEPGQLA